MTRFSKAQDFYKQVILGQDSCGSQSINVEQIRLNLKTNGIDFTDEELNALFDRLKFFDNKSCEDLSELEIYANGHLLDLYKHDNK